MYISYCECSIKKDKHKVYTFGIYNKCGFRPIMVSWDYKSLAQCIKMAEKTAKALGIVCLEGNVK